MENFPLKIETYEIIGLCMEVHRILGHGFSEVVYKDAIETEAVNRQFFLEREKELEIEYKGIVLRHKFFADFVLFNTIILEIKPCSGGFADEHIAQTLNYPKVSRCRIGLLINFFKAEP